MRYQNIENDGGGGVELLLLVRDILEIRLVLYKENQC